MKNIGFFGDLVAYPIEGEKYRIESGHRRYDAAMLADITEVPVFKLNPKMQSLAESGNYSWAILSQASQLNDFQQNMLYRKITMQGSIQSAVSGNWIKDEIDKAKCIKRITCILYTGKKNQIILKLKKKLNSVIKTDIKG